MQQTDSFLPGTEVELRGLRWEVVAAVPMGEQTLLRLRGTAGVFSGSEVDILTPFERVLSVIRQFDPDRPVLLANWLVYHQAFLLEQALGPEALLAVRPGRLRIEPYQLVPVARCLRMPRPRLLLADDVGLGKTVEAGMIITELIARRRAHRILIVTPAGPLLDQWKEEMAERFGLRLVVADRGEVDRIRKGTELGTNPFDHLGLVLASMDYLKQDRVLDWLERTSYDLVILDEAHHFSDSGADDIDRGDASQRRKLAATLARAADALILLSATPHDGHDRSFASLLELFDPSLVDGKGRVREKVYSEFVVRRLKRHVQVTHPTSGQPVTFPERRVLPVPVALEQTRHDRFLLAQRELLGFVAPELARAIRTRRYEDALAFLALLKRSVSTVHALHTTVQRVHDRYRALANETMEEADARRSRLQTLKRLQRKAAKFGILTPTEEAEREQMEVEDLAQQLSLLNREEKSIRREASMVADLAEQLSRVVEVSGIALDQDPKLDALVEQLRAIRAEEPSASVLVYTEYVDSLNRVNERLEQERFGRILTLQGSDDEETRRATTTLFRSQERIILVATDAASEGLNLHERCHHLVHLELPWNPNRLEQRNGRIDRYGQWKEPVVRYLYYKGNFEERILARLMAKYERQRKKLRFLPNTLGLGQLEMPDENILERLFKVLPGTAPTPSTFAFQSDEEESQDPDVQALLQEIDDSLKRFEATARANSWLADEGLHADEIDRRDAENARRAGQQVGEVDLVGFVKEAVILEGGQADPTSYGFVLRLPDTWRRGMEELPGWDSERGLMRLTNDLNTLATERKEPVGYLGRAHPLVQRAIERVRHLALGQNVGLDRRVSVAHWEEPDSGLLATFLARQNSRNGREWEQVLAVRVRRDFQTTILSRSDDWLPHLDSAAPTRDVWKKHFAEWGTQGQECAGEVATAALKQAAKTFEDKYRRYLGEERNRLDRWLRDEVERLCGREESPDLFSQLEQTTRLTPAERLREYFARFKPGDRTRSEAESLLRLYDRRCERVTTRLDLQPLDVAPLGLLLLIPRPR